MTFNYDLGGESYSLAFLNASDENMIVKREVKLCKPNALYQTRAPKVNHLGTEIINGCFVTKLVRDSISRQIAAVKREIPSLVDEVERRHPFPVCHDICCGIRARIRQLMT